MRSYLLARLNRIASEGKQSQKEVLVPRHGPVGIKHRMLLYYTKISSEHILHPEVILNGPTCRDLQLYPESIRAHRSR